MNKSEGRSLRRRSSIPACSPLVGCTVHHGFPPPPLRFLRSCSYSSVDPKKQALAGVAAHPSTTAGPDLLRFLILQQHRRPNPKKQACETHLLLCLSQLMYCVNLTQTCCC
ncbi:hypothetical protein BS78_07G145900 [Paspalum vaginatum]|nr:hypothetical protein BS78_07G145900 [Paspalum vaginatum]